MIKDKRTKHLQSVAEACQKAHRFEEAVAVYRQLIELNPDDDSYRMGLAWAYHDCGKKDQSVACFELIFDRELKRRIFMGFAFDELVRIYKENKNYRRLLEICEQALAMQPDDIALMGDLGDAYIRAGRAVDAVRIYERMTEMEPDASSLWCALGQARIMSDNVAGGRQAYRRAVAIDPDVAASFFSRMAQSFIQVGRMEEAESAFREGLSEHGHDAVLMLGLGDVLIQRGKIKEGVAVYRSVIASDRRAAGAYLNRLGHTLARARHHREAVAAFKEAIEHDPQNPFYYLSLSESYRSLGDMEKAAAALRLAGK